jgi:hypothetical protein
VRARWSFVVLLGAVTWGCTDGVGHPIVGDGIVAARAGAEGVSGAGAGGVSASAGLAGSGGVPSGSGGMAGAFGGGPAGSGGRDRERPPPDGNGLRPPFEEGTGGLAGGPSGEAGWMGMPPPGGTPDPVHCATVSSWDELADRAEYELFSALNVTRARGFVCGAPPGTPPDPGRTVLPLGFNPALRCAARLHSRDMSENGYLAHTNAQGVGPEDRMRDAGAVFRIAGETIAQTVAPPGGPMNPYDVLPMLLSTGGSECENLMDPNFAWVGIGVYRDRITLDFASP